MQSILMKRLLISFFILALLFIISLVIATLMVYLGYENTIKSALPKALFAFGCLLVIIGFVDRLRAKYSAGRVKLDVSSSPVRYLYIFMGLGMGLSGLGSIMSVEEQSDYILGSVGVLLSLYLLTLAFERVKICENGIYYSGTLYRWKQITSYDTGYGRGKGLVLRLNVRERLLFFSKEIEFPISHDMKDEVIILMRHYLAPNN